MKNASNIGSIIGTAVLTFASLIKLIPSTWKLGSKIESIFLAINNNKAFCFVYILVILVLACIVIINAFSNIKKEHKKHSFDPNSEKFYKFFANWYSREGDINIISNDLKWTASESNVKIFTSLKQKCISGNKLILYLKKPANGDDYDKYTKELKKLGAIVKEAPESLVNNYTYSTLRYMGEIRLVIVRKKNQNQGDKIIFEEIDNEYVSGVLNALLEVKGDE